MDERAKSPIAFRAECYRENGSRIGRSSVKGSRVRPALGPSGTTSYRRRGFFRIIKMISILTGLNRRNYT